MSGVTATYTVAPAIRANSLRIADSTNLGYGFDLALATDLYGDMRTVDPFSTQALAEALLRRLDCPRGALPDDQSYGVDVRGMINRATDPASLSVLRGQIKSECEKDDRVDSVSVELEASSDFVTLTVQLVVTPIDADRGGFSLTFVATDSDLLVQEMRAT